MIERLLNRLSSWLLSADVLGIIFIVIALQVFIYGITNSVQNTDTSPLFTVSMIALAISFGMGKTHLKGIQASVGIGTLGILIVWILGAHLIAPL